MTGRTNPYDIEGVPKYPDGLQIYRIQASRFYQVRLFVGSKYVRRSTKCCDKKEAIEFAKKFYDEIKIAERLDESIHPDTFGAFAKILIQRQTAMINRQERDRRLNVEDERKLKKDILPFFQKMSVSRITTADIEDYIDTISAERRLSPSTLSKHLVVIRKVMNEALKRNFISHIPPIPTRSPKDNPRPYFDADEYKQLYITARKISKEGIKVRYVPLTTEIYDFIVFHTNVFVRPSDLKLLKHKHIRVVKEKAEYLLITPTKSKTTLRESATMRGAVRVYERLKKRHEANGYGNPDDYVFFPEYENREYALQTIRRQFDYIVIRAGLKFDSFGNARTIYSLRHTSLMFRLLNSKNIDIFMLARNALTSVNQLERFYLSHAESRMKIENLQQFGE